MKVKIGNSEYTIIDMTIYKNEVISIAGFDIGIVRTLVKRRKFKRDEKK